MPAKKPTSKPASKAKPAPKRGRPTAYLPAYVEQAQRLAMLGLTDIEMAEFFGVAERTFHGWKRVHPDFLQSIKEGKVGADSKVADALYQRALGYSHPDVHISNYQGVITATPITKHYPPDPVSMIFWLKNRQPAKWRDKQEIQQDISITGQATGDELHQIYDERMKQARERQARLLSERGISMDEDDN